MRNDSSCYDHNKEGNAGDIADTKHSTDDKPDDTDHDTNKKHCRHDNTNSNKEDESNNNEDESNDSEDDE